MRPWISTQFRFRKIDSIFNWSKRDPRHDQTVSRAPSRVFFSLNIPADTHCTSKIHAQHYTSYEKCKQFQAYEVFFSGRYSQGEKMNLPWMLVRWKLTHNTSTMEKMYVWAFFFRRAAAGQRKASSDPGRERCKNFFSRGKVQVGCYFNAIQKPCNCCILSAKAFLNWALFIRQGAMHCSVIRLWPPRIGKVSNNSPLYAWYKPARHEQL